MVQEVKNQKEKVETYEIDNKKYTVITTCIENCENTDRLYDVLCKFVMLKFKYM